MVKRLILVAVFAAIGLLAGGCGMPGTVDTGSERMARGGLGRGTEDRHAGGGWDYIWLCDHPHRLSEWHHDITHN
jgi:hypothetical protein